ncbi:MAG: hypothetical protein IKT61_05405 [Clostridia bacterium]|nr:hypothetical protein [Clostridia bacterium]
MKKLNIKKALSVVFICVIVFFMCSILGTFLLAKIFGIYPSTMNAAEAQPDATQVQVKDWSVDYPFAGDYGFEYIHTAPVEDVEVEETGNIEQFEDYIRFIEDRVDYYTTNLLLGRMKFVELNASFNRLVGMDIVSGTDSVVVMRNGYLTYQSYEIDADYAIKSTDYFSDWLAGKDINFLYVQCPSKESPADNQLPHGVEDYYNKNTDVFLAGLDANGVPYIDLRKNMLESFDDYFACFFKTDHHWTPETGVWAAGQIADRLNKEYNYGLSNEIGKLENYNIKVYEDYCFGSQGKKATLKYADPEDISLIYPKADTDFTVQYDEGAALHGRFEDTLLKKSVFDKIDYYNISTYSAYFHGNHSISTIHNNKVTNGKRMVYIMDSFSASVIPYLATDVEDMLVLDIRSFNGSVTNVIEGFEPDMVVVAYNPSTFTADTSHNSTFNFE